MLRPEKFTEQAQEVLANSQRLVQDYRHSQWDVEHVFMALLRQEGGLTAEVLKRLGVDSRLVATRVENALANTPRVQQASAQV